MNVPVAVLSSLISAEQPVVLVSVYTWLVIDRSLTHPTRIQEYVIDNGAWVMSLESTGINRLSHSIQHRQYAS